MSSIAKSSIGGVIVPADMMSPGDLVDYVRRLEALGYDSVWIPDMFGREIYVTCGFLLDNTTTINVASGIAHVYGRDAIASAQAARTLSELSGGRFIHGVGISHPPAAELRGLTWEPPIAKMRAYLTEMKAAMSGGLLHTPADPPPVPVYVAAHGPQMMRVAADLADGANTYMQLPDHTRESRATLGPDKALSVVLPCVMTTDPDAAREAGRRSLSIYLPLPAYQRQWVAQGFDETDWAGRGSDRLIDAFIAWGDRDAILDRIEQHIAAGATQVQLGVNTPGGTGSGSAWDLLEALAPN
jgi:probable F420-dependent oxidoreductase